MLYCLCCVANGAPAAAAKAEKAAVEQDVEQDVEQGGPFPVKIYFMSDISKGGNNSLEYICERDLGQSGTRRRHGRHRRQRQGSLFAPAVPVLALRSLPNLFFNSSIISPLDF